MEDTKVTDEWLETIGFQWYRPDATKLDRFLALSFPIRHDCHELALEKDERNAWYISQTWDEDNPRCNIPTPQTKDQVLKLIAAHDFNINDEP